MSHLTPAELAELRLLIAEWSKRMEPLLEAHLAVGEAHIAVFQWLKAHHLTNETVGDAGLPLGYVTMLKHITKFVDGVDHLPLHLPPRDDLLDWIKEPKGGRP